MGKTGIDKQPFTLKRVAGKSHTQNVICGIRHDLI